MESGTNKEQQVYINGSLINFIDLINKNDIKSALYLLNVEDIDPNIISPRFDKTYLMLACKKGQISIVNRLASLQGCNHCFLVLVALFFFEILVLVLHILH